MKNKVKCDCFERCVSFHVKNDGFQVHREENNYVSTTSNATT